MRRSGPCPPVARGPRIEPVSRYYGHCPGVRTQSENPVRSMVTPLTFVGDDVALVQALRAGHPGAAAAFYDQHAAHVYRALRSTIGLDDDLPDLLQDVFVRAIDHLDELQDLSRVRSWLTSVAIFTARAHIRRRSRRKWLSAFLPIHTSSQQSEPP